MRDVSQTGRADVLVRVGFGSVSGSLRNLR